jgi:trehalose 6-phosphate synthase
MLRRVFLTPEEQKGYYLGFANEGLWPLCHIAHTRPVFRPEDWEYYQRVNQKFAEVTLEEIQGLKEPWLWIQDYHFTLLPRLIKEQRPDARIALFWHIPWPNPEAFGICPWQSDLLEGMLGADLIGFHTQFHCNNFLDTVNRVLESRIDWDRFAVMRGDHLTTVKPFPISVDFPEPMRGPLPIATEADRRQVMKGFWINSKYLGVGVDRIDYTKGILERLRGIERFLEKYPEYQGNFTFFQIGAPSRTDIPRYRDFVDEVKVEVERINTRFKGNGNKAIYLMAWHHSHAEIQPYYRAADVCLVTSLHDGMNLVAKEFVAARTDEQGVLILSCFTGAAREMRDALVVNPYDVNAIADSIYEALEMSNEEKALRMTRLRAVVRENNIYRWAANLLTELGGIRLSQNQHALAGSNVKSEKTTA